MALWEEDAELLAEAIQSLEATFGDDLPAVLKRIRPYARRRLLQSLRSIAMTIGFSVPGIAPCGSRTWLELCFFPWYSFLTNQNKYSIIISSVPAP